MFVLKTVASLILGFLGYLFIVWIFPKFSQTFLGREDWNLLEGFTSLISLILLIGGLTFTLTEYFTRERKKFQEELAEEREKDKLSYEIYQAIYEKLTNPEQESARRWILSEISIKESNEKTDDWFEETNRIIMSTTNGGNEKLPTGQKSIKLTLNCFDYIGFIAEHYWDIEDDSLDWISAPIAKVWIRLRPYVMHIRKLRGIEDYYTSAEYIGDTCVEWRKEKGWLDEKYVHDTP